MRFKAGAGVGVRVGVGVGVGVGAGVEDRVGVWARVQVTAGDKKPLQQYRFNQFYSSRYLVGEGLPQPALQQAAAHLRLAPIDRQGLGAGEGESEG